MHTGPQLEKLERKGSIELSLESGVRNRTLKNRTWLRVASAVFVVVAFLSFHFLYWQGTLSIPSLALFILPVCLSIVTVAVMAAKRKKLKIWGYTIGTILIFGFLSIWLIPSIACARERHMSEVCVSNLQTLYKIMNGYAKEHNGHLPSVNQWCDLLIDYDKSFPKDVLRCPAARYGTCNYTINKNLEGFRLVDVPRDVVLFYESHGGWNLAGGPEMLEPRHSGGRICFILLVDGTVRSYGVKFPYNDPLRWKP